jgi:hypothetical protein
MCLSLLHMRAAMLIERVPHNSPPVLQIVSYDDVFDAGDYIVEIDFFTANPTLGNITFWPYYGCVDKLCINAGVQPITWRLLATIRAQPIQREHAGRHGARPADAVGAR